MQHTSLSWLGLLAVALVFGWVSAQDETETETVTGVIGQSIKLSCDIDGETPSDLEWRDLVYNTNRKPILIGQKSGDEVTFNDKHYKDGNYEIEGDGSLVIVELKDEDAGSYICKHMTSDGKRKNYELVLISVPTCTGEGMLEEEMDTQLSCEMRSVGSIGGSAMDWYADARKMDKDEVKDMSSIGVLLKDVHLKASPDMDQVLYSCRSSVGSLNQECSILLDVKYLVRDVKIEPHTDVVHAGDVVNCSARGNPAPMINWDPALPAKLVIPSGDAPWVAFKVDKSWEGQTKKFTCHVSNSYSGMKETVEEEITFKIQKKMEEKPQDQGEPGANEGDKDDPESASESGSSVAGIVAGMIIGALVLVVIVIAIICIRKKNSKKPKGSHPVPTKNDDVRKIDMDGKGGISPPVELTKVEKQSSASNHCEQVPLTNTSPYDVENPQCDQVSEKDNLLADDDLDFQLNTESDMGLELNGFEGFSTADIQNDSTLPIRGSTVIDDQDQYHPQQDEDSEEQPDSNGVLPAGDYNHDQETLPLNGS